MTRRRIKEKFAEERREKINDAPLRALTKKQQTYIELLEDKTVIIATGFAGTSKTYIPTMLAADKYRLNETDAIVFCRPAVSNSKSLGFFAGDKIQKMEEWLSPVIRILRKRLGNEALEIAIKHDDIVYQPLETIKGCSFDNSWIIIDEAEDLAVDEIIKIVTRVGRNSKLIFAGDITQSELKDRSGLKFLIDFAERQKLSNDFGFVDFNSTDDIVRSDAVKSFIVALNRDVKEYGQY